jgi:asparagine synthase (glutamine-hydrolysing)
MCGIFALFGEEVEVSSYLLSHRGPDRLQELKRLGKCRMDFYRLAINDLNGPNGMQPFRAWQFDAHLQW